MRKNGKLYPKKICSNWLLCSMRKECTHARVHFCRRKYIWHRFEPTGCGVCIVVDDGAGGEQNGQKISGGM